ncbi:hypothetical protein PG994_003932 [Apiospora phragmitis]|uniref:Uncharacterized protein n=1 Tax=Apiospora phragmitis TaxID=2905665 RepID=A0ABR1VZJ6_9PEZI
MENTALTIQQRMAELLSHENTRTHVSAEEDVGVSQRIQSYFVAALEAMAQWDMRRLIIYLRLIVYLPTSELQHVIQTLPRTTISEFLRSLDPKRVAPDIDPTDGARISTGMYHLLGLGQHMDSYGTRKLFGKLLIRMNLLVRCAHAAGLMLDSNDYISLFRVYGAISDIAGAKRLWDETFGATKRQPSPDALHEFIKVRYLVDPMYYGFDKTRLVVTPRNLHRRGYLRFHQSVRRLDRLRFHRQGRAARFGLDRSMPTAMSLTRRVRGQGPITRLFKSWIARHHDMTEEVVCSFMIGTGEITTENVAPTGTRTNSANRQQRKGDFLRPTARLLNTIVEVYCSNAQLGWAFNILDFISREYQIPIPAETWFDLLEWSHVLSSTPATSWKMAGWYQQIPAEEATEFVWSTMTQEPYNVQPGFDQYAILLRSRIARGHFIKADDEVMEKMQTLYDEQCARYEKSVFNYIGTVRDGVVPVTAVLSAYQCARFRMQQMWFTLSEVSKRNIKRLRASNLTDHRAVVGLPDFIWRHARFVDNPVRYRLATGYVSLSDPARPRKLVLYKRRIQLDMPMKVKGTWRLVSRRPWRSHVMWSGRSLAEFRNSRLDPMPLLSGTLDAFRLPTPRTETQLLEWRRASKRMARGTGKRRKQERKPEERGDPSVLTNADFVNAYPKFKLERLLKKRIARAIYPQRKQKRQLKKLGTGMKTWKPGAGLRGKREKRERARTTIDGHVDDFERKMLANRDV